MIPDVGRLQLQFAGAAAEALSPAWFEQVLASLSVTEQRLLPSWWLSSAILDAAARPRDGDAWGPLVEAVV